MALILPARLSRAPIAPATTKVSLPAMPKGIGRGGDLDSRMRKPNLSLDGSLERCFCVSCGAPSGWVTSEVVSVATYVCRNCTEKGGGPLDLPRINIAE